MEKPTAIISFLGLIVAIALLVFTSCKKENENNEVNVGYVNIAINPNSTQYLELNTVGGWLYLIANPPSRGIIVYRLSQDEFRAYERTPPHKPDECCKDGLCTKLIVDFPFVEDTCLAHSFQILDGSPLSPATKPLVQYNTYYDGTVLRITTN